MKRAVIPIIAGALIAAGASAYVSLRQRAPQERPVPPSAQLRPAPDFEIVMYQGTSEVGGSTIALSSLWETEKRPVVLNFWAGLCPPCRAEMPDFQRLYNERDQRSFTLIGVDIGPFIGLGSREDGRALLRELGVMFPAGTTFDARTLRDYQILGMPTTVFITAGGRILRKHAGLLTRGQMAAFTEELIRASGAKYAP
ncbi:MAG: TlpA disulfide reductase family protein [Armatimonadota bacterium]|nr:TlpA disulfide reductase family protein [Armatimonadota bacterium]